MSDGAWYGREKWNNSMPDETTGVTDLKEAVVKACKVWHVECLRFTSMTLEEAMRENVGPRTRDVVGAMAAAVDALIKAEGGLAS